MKRKCKSPFILDPIFFYFVLFYFTSLHFFSFHSIPIYFIIHFIHSISFFLFLFYFASLHFISFHSIPFLSVLLFISFFQFHFFLFLFHSFYSTSLHFNSFYITLHSFMNWYLILVISRAHILQTPGREIPEEALDSEKTPCSKALIAKQLIECAKQYEKEGDYEQALHCYKKGKKSFDPFAKCHLICPLLLSQTID